MKRLLAVLMVLVGLALVNRAEGGPFLHRLHFHAAGPLMLPIPAFPPFFPGGNITIQPRDGGDPNAPPAPPPALKIDAKVKSAIEALNTKIAGDDFLKTTNGIPALPNDLRGRDKAYNNLQKTMPPADKGGSDKKGANNPNLDG